MTFRRCDDGDQTGEVCRVACATEVAEAHPPSTCVPTHVRVKQRRRFEDVRVGKVVWAYELSKVWSKSSSSVVEHLQPRATVYEVECELVDEGAYLANHTDAEVAERSFQGRPPHGQRRRRVGRCGVNYASFVNLVQANHKGCCKTRRGASPKSAIEFCNSL